MGLGEGFYRIKRLPPYVFAQVQSLKLEARQRGEDIIDFGMGNPDQPTPSHIVEKMIEAARKGKNHRYSASRGITKLRHAICAWYKRNYDVDLDPETEAIVTIGSKEGLAHLALATIGPGDVVLTPTPTYPIHMYSFIIAGGEVRGIELRQDSDFFEDLTRVYRQTFPRPKILVINFPHNPTTAVVTLEFFKKIVAFAKEHNVIVIHDLAYADLVFDGYKAPSFLQIPGAKDCGVEFYTLVQGLQHAGLAGGILCGQSRGRRSAGEDQKLPRLWNFSAASNRQRDRIERSSGLCQGDGSALSETERHAGGWAESDRLAGRQAVGHDVCVGAHSLALSAYGFAGVLEASPQGGESRGLAGDRIRGRRR